MASILRLLNFVSRSVRTAFYSVGSVTEPILALIPPASVRRKNMERRRLPAAVVSACLRRYISVLISALGGEHAGTFKSMSGYAPR